MTAEPQLYVPESPAKAAELSEPTRYWGPVLFLASIASWTAIILAIKILAVLL